jgi:hypothetical protein
LSCDVERGIAATIKGLENGTPPATSSYPISIEHITASPAAPSPPVPSGVVAELHSPGFEECTKRAAADPGFGREGRDRRADHCGDKGCHREE